MRFRAMAIAALAASAAAQTGSAQQNPVAIAPINNWNYQHHTSTLEEAYLRGAASVIQSQGEANYANSLAAVNFQEAYRRQLENSRLYVQVFLERKEMVHQYLERYGHRPPSKEQLDRVYRNSLPDRLTAEQYDVASGRLVWPHILRDEAYAPLRKRIDELMATRTPENSGDGSPWQRQLHQLVENMRRTLKQNMDTVTVQQYANARWFLVCLDYEGTLRPGDTTGLPTAGLTANGQVAAQEAIVIPPDPVPAAPAAAVPAATEVATEAASPAP